MTSKSFSCSFVSAPILTAAAASLALLGASQTARAEEVSPSGKGITGSALLGAEVVMLTEAAVGVKPGWAYVLGGVLGAGAAAYPGYLLERDADPKISLYLLAGGMALVIPTTVAVLQATSYKPPEDYTEDHPSTGVPVAEPPRPAGPATSPAVPPGGSGGAPSTPDPLPPPPPGSALPSPAAPVAKSLHLKYHWSQATLRLSPGLLDFQDGAMQVAFPAVELRPVYSLQELARYGLTQQSELRVPVLAARF